METLVGLQEAVMSPLSVGRSSVGPLSVGSFIDIAEGEANLNSLQYDTVSLLLNPANPRVVLPAKFPGQIVQGQF